jgi:hypothetical protein
MTLILFDKYKLMRYALAWLRHRATSRMVTGYIPEGVTGIFHWLNLCGCTMTLGSTQHVALMSTRNAFCGVKSGWCVGLTTLPPSCAECLEIWEPHPFGTLRACLACIAIALSLQIDEHYTTKIKFYQIWEYHNNEYKGVTVQFGRQVSTILRCLLYPSKLQSITSQKTLIFRYNFLESWIHKSF